MQLIIQCWTDAETRVRDYVSTKGQGANETNITYLFASELRGQAHELNQTQKLEQAFIQDLQDEYPGLKDSSAWDCAHRLRASVVFHPPQIEKKSGADLGLVLTRPDSTYLGSHRFHLVSRGLLCQAKLKKPVVGNGYYLGRFKPKQTEFIRNHPEFTSILLYEYSDLELATLNDFKWKHCVDFNFRLFRKSLKRPAVMGFSTSEEIIKALHSEKIGTSDEQVIRTIIRPQVASYLVINIGWPKDRPIWTVEINQQEEARHLRNVLRW
jgi:hypothetical protein